MSADLTLPDARTERDRLADRTDVLDRIGTLRTLPDDMHVMTQQVADFYEVDREAVTTLVKRNREEFEDDGYRVLTRGTFKEKFTMNLSSQTARVALFPRRAVLRVGMLLRDSIVARRVRDMLLDVEHLDAAVTPALPMSDDELVLHALQIQQRKIRVLTEKITTDAPKVQAYEAWMESDGTYSMNAAAKVIGWGRNVMMRQLRLLGVLQGNNLPYQRYEHHFKVVPGVYTNRKTGEKVPTAVTYVRPSGLAFLSKKLNPDTAAAALPAAAAVEAVTL